MKQKYFLLCSLAVAAVFTFPSAVLALEEAEVESAIAASSKNEVAGNIFIWFLCAVAFLKISQKIDSFLSGLGMNVGRTGGSMLGELIIAGRVLGATARSTGGVMGNLFQRGQRTEAGFVHSPGYTGSLHICSPKITSRRKALQDKAFL